MEFFDGLIAQVNAMLEGHPARHYSFNAENAWEDSGESHIIFQKDTALELGGTGFNLVTALPLEKSETVVVGDDLNKISEKRKFARVSFIQIDDIADEQQAYDLIRKIEYVKYHYFPTGFMLRTSSEEQIESVRVSKTAVKNGISFEKAGNLLNGKFLENNAVKNVKTVYITDASFDFDALDEISQKNSEITKTLNHIMKGISFDCKACKLKPICDEVEGMRELHFKTGSPMGR